MKGYTYYRHNKCSKVFMTLRMFRLLISSICHPRDVMTPHCSIASSIQMPSNHKFTNLVLGRFFSFLLLIMIIK